MPNGPFLYLSSLARVLALLALSGQPGADGIILIRRLVDITFGLNRFLRMHRSRGQIYVLLVWAT